MDEEDITRKVLVSLSNTLLACIDEKRDRYKCSRSFYIEQIMRWHEGLDSLLDEEND